MKIKMLRSKMGSNDGATTKLYEKGEEYDVSESLAQSFIEENLAEEVSTRSKAASQPEFVEGDLYHDEKGDLFVAVTQSPGGDVSLLPIERLGDDERADLIAEGKLKEDGTAVDAKAIDAAPKNKAIGKAPKNKAAR